MKTFFLLMVALMTSTSAGGLNWQTLTKPGERVAYLYATEKTDSLTTYYVINWYKEAVPGDEVIKTTVYFRNSAINSFTCSKFYFYGADDKNIFVGRENYSLTRKNDTFLVKFIDQYKDGTYEKAVSITGGCNYKLGDNLDSEQFSKIDKGSMELKLSNPAKLWIPDSLWNKAVVTYDFDKSSNELMVDVVGVK
jgi:hypothetical protein